MKSLTSKHAPRGFSLVELLVVILIIALLTGLGITGYGQVRDRVNYQKVKVQVRQITTAIDSLILDGGLNDLTEFGLSPTDFDSDRGYPIGDGGVNSTQVLYRALGGYKDAERVEGAEIYLVDIDPADKKFVSDSFQLLDPFGNAYLYLDGNNDAAVGEFPHNVDFDFWSIGKEDVPDNDVNTENNEGNW